MQHIKHYQSMLQASAERPAIQICCGKCTNGKGTPPGVLPQSIGKEPRLRAKVRRLHRYTFDKHQTGTLREVEARNVTEYLARTILESREQRDHRQSVKSAALEHHGRLVNDFDKASNYHTAARELASEAKGHEPLFTDKERINLEIYAARHGDEKLRESYLQLAREEGRST